MGPVRTLALPYVPTAYSMAVLITGNLDIRSRNSTEGTSISWTILNLRLRLRA